MIFPTKEHIPQVRSGLGQKRPIVDLSISWGKHKPDVSALHSEMTSAHHINVNIITAIYPEVWYKVVPTIQRYNFSWVFDIYKSVDVWNRYDLARYRRLTREIQNYLKQHRAAVITRLENEKCRDDQTELMSSSGPHPPTGTS